MSGGASVPVVALITHARDVPSAGRDQFATELHRQPAHAALLVETCHRVEAYLVGDQDSSRLAEALPGGGRVLTGEEAVRHAMTVAVGRDSVVVGEDQILHQIRTSVDAARTAGSLDPALERLFALALHAGRRARSWRQGPARSLADVALASIERQAGPVRGRDILVVGAGKMGRLAVTAATAAGAHVAVANRSADRGAALAASAGARTETFDPDLRVGGFAAVIVALAGPWSIGAAAMDAIVKGRLVVVDLSVPAAVPAELAGNLGARLITADDLATSDVGPAALDGSSARLDALVDGLTAEFLAWLEGREARTTAQALVQRADREREAELAALWRRLPDLAPETREAIEGMTRHLTDRLLREPLERLGRDADGRDGRAIRDIFAL